jgi:hypothetical protein
MSPARLEPQQRSDQGVDILVGVVMPSRLSATPTSSVRTSSRTRDNGLAFISAGTLQFRVEEQGIMMSEMECARSRVQWRIKARFMHGRGRK